MRSDTAFFSAAAMFRRFLSGLASDLLSAVAAAFVGEEERHDVERAAGADAPRICSTSVSALISAWRRSISLCRSAIACAMALSMTMESSGPAMGMSNTRLLRYAGHCCRSRRRGSGRLRATCLGRAGQAGRPERPAPVPAAAAAGRSAGRR